MAVSKDYESLDRGEFMDTIEQIENGRHHLPNGRQSRSVILENKLPESNILIPDDTSHRDSILSQDQIDDAEALMFMINENLS